MREARERLLRSSAFRCRVHSFVTFWVILRISSALIIAHLRADADGALAGVGKVNARLREVKDEYDGFAARRAKIVQLRFESFAGVAEGAERILDRRRPVRAREDPTIVSRIIAKPTEGTFENGGKLDKAPFIVRLVFRFFTFWPDDFLVTEALLLHSHREQ